MIRELIQEIKKPIETRYPRLAGKKLTKGSYPALRGEIEDGDMICYEAQSWRILYRPFAIGICLRTGSWWSHVGVARWIGGRLFLLEARPVGGVAPRPMSGRLDDGAYWIPLNVGYAKKEDHLATEKFGKIYGFLDILMTAIGLNTFFKGMHCAEYFKHVYGIKNKDEQNGIEDTPVAIVEWALERVRTT
uniref:Uncharacterized protein n=1 Tax=Candidatus Kentrum sp. UNK TaxID=2126344 RepID=A0A451ARH2_9GAMM|nr:MAG: hypothetical protein BECKUNK1418G_GA0071005_100526 [Candidatus Kentron sp. UNK]VFK68602.1 MAG: hypothetical protein BECKUNK1418H_GA0071006_100426 [Candidatus Kentron sp. UNK]